VARNQEVSVNARLAFSIVVFLTIASSFPACERDKRRERFRVIGRANPNDAAVVYELPVILEHDGHKYYAKCNNIKAVEDPKVTRHCELHVGMTLECQFFNDREPGYDLICGTRRDVEGNLSTYGENELLTIDKEEH
jgi:hypothetical protein